ncbi:rRNA-processing protein [Tasmannia lanceolata]|uniref:rRNA-processing protein n=1 Tax=Tasmannia lanceolata TaxID=3420 RepID=UPI004062F273
MKNRTLQNNRNESNENEDRSKPMMRRKNRLGGKGLSLEAFAKAKSIRSDYKPSIKKKKREFYKNAKYVNKFKKSLKQQSGMQDHLSVSAVLPEDGNEIGNGKKMKKKNSFHSLRREYEKRHEEEEKARMEREAIIQAKKEERGKAEARRKMLREKMFKKTRSGQPVMKYRIEHLLESIQAFPN